MKEAISFDYIDHFETDAEGFEPDPNYYLTNEYGNYKIPLKFCPFCGVKLNDNKSL
jgi:hypothetical protein